MGKTRWGKNWGSFERVEWIDDVQIDDVSTLWFVLESVS
jgi:hypothetical protein